jgi:hypothetical protein
VGEDQKSDNRQDDFPRGDPAYPGCSENKSTRDGNAKSS